MKITVRAHEIAGLLDRAPPGIGTLSLDCFDTLLWRNVHAPRDIFAEVAAPGGGVEPRQWAQASAQRAAHARTGSHEVAIEDIYRRMRPGAHPAEIDVLVAHELAMEARHCFPFAPVVALMRAAKARGLQIVIVSDTYLSELQLRALIGAAAGADVLAMIDRVFVSSEHGQSKAAGLFGPVLAALGVAPGSILHLGDNRTADQDAPFELGIATAHFRQFSDASEQRLRLEAAAAALVDPSVRVSHPTYMPHRAAVSCRADDDPAHALGHDVVGPAMHAFARWVHDEAAAMAVELGRPVKPLFLMRDGYLPMQAYRTLYPDAWCAPVEISRLIAVRASMSDRATMIDTVTDEIWKTPLDALARQLMLYGHESAKLIKDPARHDPAEAEAFAAAVGKPPLRDKITTRAGKVVDKLVAHLRRAGVADGDAVMLVDIGYNGSVQNLLTPVLAKRMGLTVAGRYLFLREEAFSGLDKKGLLDNRHYETRALHGLATCVAVIEQLCNVAQGSTTDYNQYGEPVREAAGSKAQQNTIRDAVQAAALAFVAAADGGAAMHRAPASDGAEARRRMTAAILARLFFMPIAEEVALFDRFDQDMNLGTGAMLKLFDTDEAAERLRRRGFGYINEVGRMYVPGELHGHGLPLNLSLLTSSRFGLELCNGDFEHGGCEVPVMLLDGAGDTRLTLPANKTADGWYRVTVPVGAGRFTAAVQLGQLAEWVQIDDVSFHRVEDLDRDGPPRAIPAAKLVDAMQEQAPGLYRCDDTGVVVVPAIASATPLALTLVFRPLVWRDAAQAARQAA